MQGDDALCWLELCDQLQGEWDPGTGVLEIQARGVKTRYRLVAAR